MFKMAGIQNRIEFIRVYFKEEKRAADYSEIIDNLIFFHILQTGVNLIVRDF